MTVLRVCGRPVCAEFTNSKIILLKTSLIHKAEFLNYSIGILFCKIVALKNIYISVFSAKQFSSA